MAAPSAPCAPKPEAPTASPAARSTAHVVVHEPTGTLFLQGREEFTPRSANIFGSRDFNPVCGHFDKKIEYEAEVSYRYSETADDDGSDHSEVYGFRIWGWDITPQGASARLMFGDWEYFQGDDPPGADYGWDALLYEAVHQLREARAAHRHNRSLSPRLIGEPFTPEKPPHAPSASASIWFVNNRSRAVSIEILDQDRLIDYEFEDEDARFLMRVHYADGQVFEQEWIYLETIAEVLFYTDYIGLPLTVLGTASEIVNKRFRRLPQEQTND